VNSVFKSGKVWSRREIRLLVSMVFTLLYLLYCRLKVLSACRISSSGMYRGSLSQLTSP
jgi:hypothetical protein